ncbi:unnamed protein product [Clavelina lepadiformis]|uniref:Uncharacterized protein n=1 Tax=Clavelina lepadiformis TaxID=159417 RepID=A0ABP0EZE5_CLALP
MKLKRNAMDLLTAQIEATNGIAHHVPCGGHFIALVIKLMIILVKEEDVYVMSMMVGEVLVLKRDII